jgi:hypothetical protein
MNIVWGFFAIAGACAVGVTALLLVRPPEGGFFGDGDRAAGVFGVLATGFSILIGSVIAIMAALLLLLRGLDQPFHDGVGGLQPTAMQRSLRMADEALRSIGAQMTIPCDARGRPGAS